MTFDPATILILSCALAAAAAFYLAVEWFSVREDSLALWGLGFAIISAGSAVALLRSRGFLLIGIWFANGGLIVAHWLFLAGVFRLRRICLTRIWYPAMLIWPLMLLLPEVPWWSGVMLFTQSLLIGGMTLHASFLLRPYGNALSTGAVQLRYVLLMHGLFYVFKAGIGIALQNSLDLASFQGIVIKISLGEGLLAIILIALSMTGTERHRREQLTFHDPLTALRNRRGLELQAESLLGLFSDASPGVLLLISVENIKQVNYLHGHSAGDKLLVTLSELISSTFSDDALAARLNGTRFVILSIGLDAVHVTALCKELCVTFTQTAREAFPIPDAVALRTGVSELRQPTDNLAAWLARGELAMSQSHSLGTDQLDPIHTV